MHEVEKTSTLMVFRDSDQPNAFYFLPTAYGLGNTSGTGQRLGVQVYSDQKVKSTLDAAVTLSVSPKASRDQLNQVLENIKQAYKLDNPKLTPPARVRTRLVAYQVGDPVKVLATTTWSNAVIDSPQSITFNVANLSKVELRRLLSGDGSALAVVVEMELEGVVDGVASGRIHGDVIRDLAKKRGTVMQGSDFDSFLSDVLDHAVDVAPQDRPFLRDATRLWIRERLGPPSLIRENQKLAYGWRLSTTGLVKAEDGSMQVVLGAPRSESATAIVELGNLCTAAASAILNLDDGSSGCGSLR